MRKIVVFAVAALITMLWCAPAPVGKGKVTIKRDGYGVPHVYADSVYGVFSVMVTPEPAIASTR